MIKDWFKFFKKNVEDDPMEYLQDVVVVPSSNRTFTKKSRENQLKWDLRFLRLAKEVSTWSKDPSTQVGAVIVRPNRTIASVGFNGFSKYKDDDPELYNTREIKYRKIIHAEMNAVFFCQDRSLKGYTLYTYPFLTCERCFQNIAQNEFSRIVAPFASEDILSRWGNELKAVREDAIEAGIEIVELDFK